MAKITKNEVEHIAKLARLELTESQKEKMAGEMGAILEYVEKLNALDVQNVEPTAHVTGLENIFREDDQPHGSGVYSNKLVDQFPEKQDAYNKVKGIIKNR